MVLMQAVTGLPADSPWWAVVAFIAISGAATWFARRQDARDKARLDAEAEERRRRAEAETDERRWRREMEERSVKSQEEMTRAIDQIGRTLTAMDFRMGAIERHLNMPALGKSRARGAHEGERGE